MTQLNENCRRKAFELVFKANPTLPTKELIKRANELEISERAAYRLLKMLRNNENINRKVGKGLNGKKLTNYRKSQLGFTRVHVCVRHVQDAELQVGRVPRAFFFDF